MTATCMSFDIPCRLATKRTLLALAVISLMSCGFLYNSNYLFDTNCMDKISFIGRVRLKIDWIVDSPMELRFFNSSKAFNESYIPFLKELGLIGDREDYVDLSQPLPNVTFVTAFSENHVAEGRSLIKRLAKDHPDWKIVIYDLGINKASRIFFEEACNVASVRDIDLAHFGVHKKLKTYRFKPIVISIALNEFPVIFWMDTSTFFNANMSVRHFMDRINITDGQGPHVYVVEKQAVHSTYAATTAGMYDYLAPQGDIYERQHGANRMIFVRTKTTIDLALKWFVLCALEESCMAPAGSQLKCNFSAGYIHNLAGCHRYDQSAINLILGPYPKSLLGPWAREFAQTKWGVTANDIQIKC